MFLIIEAQYSRIRKPKTWQDLWVLWNMLVLKFYFNQIHIIWDDAQKIIFCKIKKKQKRKSQNTAVWPLFYLSQHSFKVLSQSII